MFSTLILWKEHLQLNMTESFILIISDIYRLIYTLRKRYDIRELLCVIHVFWKILVIHMPGKTGKIKEQSNKSTLCEAENTLMKL